MIEYFTALDIMMVCQKTDVVSKLIKPKLRPRKEE